ncbi:MAG TPA: PilZ domain-containing protein [Pyrinomonadaceae bacterium]
MTDENILEIEESSTDNRRQFDRRPVNIEIQFDGGDARGQATTRDIGIGGLYMATDARLLEGAALLLRMNLGNQDLMLYGVVAYCDPGHGVGVRFHNLTPEVENILKSHVHST